jgi:hypothetical protein
MIRRPLILVLLSVFAFGAWTSTRMKQSASQGLCTQDHNAWVSHALERMETIKTGMTREELLKIFATEGGLSTGLRRTFVSQDCPYFKVDVEFKPVGRPNYGSEGQVTLVEDGRDIIVKISRPYLQFSIMD